MERLYYFTAANHALENIAKRRIKVSAIESLNDPFEFIPLNLSDKDRRRYLEKLRESFGKKYGIICFSKGWRHPLMWAHYASKHQGACLGFDVEETHLIKVEYRRDRIKSPVLCCGQDQVSNPEDLMRGLSQYKHLCWEYEDEVRLIVPLKDCEVVVASGSGRMYFKSFDHGLVLKEFIAGARFTGRRREVEVAVNGLGLERLFKARLAFRTYGITENLNRRLWR